MSDKISDIYAREILDSRGNPTLEVTVEAGGQEAKASVPSGASTGSHEAYELRDKDQSRYGGQGVLKATENVNTKIKEALRGFSVEDISKLDQRMIDLDGTDNKSKLGANAILGVSLASSRLAAQLNTIELYQFIRQVYNFKLKDFKLPVPLCNIINGGKHADSNLDFQEFWIIPKGVDKFRERVRAISEIFHALGKIIQDKGYDSDVGNEGGYAPDVKNTEEVWQMIMQAISRSGYQAGLDIFLGMDVGASEFYEDERYNLTLENQKYNSDELSEVYQKWLAGYPILAFEDPFSEDDWTAWQKFTKQIGSINKETVIIGDDLFTTSPDRLQKGIDEKSANAILIKLNQIGTLTETINCIKLAQSNNFKIAVSHRSGETSDHFIADLAVAVNSEYIKTGAPSRSERVVKYNRLMEIEEDLEKK